MQLEPVNIVQILLISQCLFFSLFLLTQKRGKKVSNGLFAAFLLVLAVHMMLNVIFETEMATTLPDITHSFGFLYGPLFYVYIKGLIYQGFQLQKRDILHLLPWVLALPVPWLFPGMGSYLGWFIFASLVCYLGFTFHAIRWYHRVLQDTQSVDEAMKLSWVRRVVYLLVAIGVLDALRNLTPLADIPALEQASYLLLIVLLFVFVNIFVFKGLKQPEIFAGITEADEEVSQAIQRKYQASTMADDEEAQVARQLMQVMEQEKPFLDAGLTLKMLAERMEVSPRHLSQVINSHYGQNFSEFVNGFRIKEAQHRFAHPEDARETILEVLYAVGFNSKSNFNHTFKRITGVTPSQYKKSLVIREED